MGALLSNEKESSLKRQFSQIDTNHDGLISKEELYRFFKKQDKSITEEQIKLFFYWIDENCDGYLNFYEFVDSLLETNKQKNIRIFAKNLFREYDKNKDGFINFNEYQLMNATLPNTILDQDQLRRDFQLIDTDNDGKISLDETYSLKSKMGSSLRKDEREILEKKFASIDKNGDGRISKEEMHDYFRSSGAFSMRETFINFYIYFVDADSDGYLNFYEFVDFISNTKKDYKLFARNLFQDYDKNKDGFLNLDEVHFMNESFSFPFRLSSEVVEKEFKEMDSNGDGRISVDEFAKYFEKTYAGAF